MLILGRRVGERLIIGENIVLTVLESRGGSTQIRLGIEAPDDVKIIREELISKNSKTISDEGLLCQLRHNTKL